MEILFRFTKYLIEWRTCNQIRKVKLKDILRKLDFRLVVQHKQVSGPIRYRP